MDAIDRLVGIGHVETGAGDIFDIVAVGAKQIAFERSVDKFGGLSAVGLLEGFAFEFEPRDARDAVRLVHDRVYEKHDDPDEPDNHEPSPKARLLIGKFLNEIRSRCKQGRFFLYSARHGGK